MPSSEFRLLPRLPIEFKKYKVVSPQKLGRMLTLGYTTVAVLSYDVMLGNGSVVHQTRFLLGKGTRSKVSLKYPPPELHLPPRKVVKRAAPASEENTTEVAAQPDTLAEDIAQMKEEVQRESTAPVSIPTRNDVIAKIADFVDAQIDLSPDQQAALADLVDFRK